MVRVRNLSALGWGRGSATFHKVSKISSKDGRETRKDSMGKIVPRFNGSRALRSVSTTRFPEGYVKGSGRFIRIVSGRDLFMVWSYRRRLAGSLSTS